MVEIIHKTKNYVVIKKPSGIPSQKDNSGDKDAMTLTAELLASLGEASALWLVHRLDRNVGGLLVFARNQRYAARLSEAVRDREISKEYLAVVDGEAAGGEMFDMLYKDSRIGKAFVVDKGKPSAKEARLSYRALGNAVTERGTKTLVAIALDTGRFHQIRAQFSSRGFPLTGDGKYGSKDKGGEGIALFAFGLMLPTEEGVSFSSLPDVTKYPWCLFDEKIYRSL